MAASTAKRPRLVIDLTDDGDADSTIKKRVKVEDHSKVIVGIEDKLLECADIVAQYATKQDASVREPVLRSKVSISRTLLYSHFYLAHQGLGII